MVIRCLLPCHCARKSEGKRGREIVEEYLRKDPTAVTGYLRQGEGLKREVEKVVSELSKNQE
jgi:hypothetical protein